MSQEMNEAGTMVLAQRDNTSSNSSSDTRVEMDPLLEKCSKETNLHGDTGDATAVHVGSATVDETPEPSEIPKPPEPTEIPKTTFIEKLKDDWKNRSTWDNIAISKSWVVFFLASSFCVIHVYDNYRTKDNQNPSIKGNYQLDCEKLNRTFESTSLDITLISFHFVHNDSNHLRNNELGLIVCGVFIECILGSIPFLFIFFGLCYSIPIEWYKTKLQDNLCGTAHPVVGASGVVLALVPIVAILSFCSMILIISVLFNFLYLDHSKTTSMPAKKRKIGCSLKFWLITIYSILYCIVFTIFAVIQYRTDRYSSQEGTANDIHLIGLKHGAIAGSPIGICYILRTIFWPIIRLRLEESDEKNSLVKVILFILDAFFGFRLRFKITDQQKPWTKKVFSFLNIVIGFGPN